MPHNIFSSLIILMSVIGYSVSVCPGWKSTNVLGFKSGWWTDVYHVSTWLICNKKCDENSNCKYWTWHVPNGNQWENICRLMEKPTRMVEDVNTISGMKCSACSLLPGIILENPDNKREYSGMQHPEDCTDKCNKLGASCNYWSWKTTTNNICTTMTNYTMMTEDAFAISGCGSYCLQKSHDSVDTLSVTLSHGTPTVIFPPGIPGMNPSTEYQFFKNAWTGTPFGESFEAEVQTQAQAHFNAKGNLGGFRVNFREIPNNPGINDYEGLVRQTTQHIVGKGRNFIRQMLNGRQGARAILRNRAGRLYDAAHERMYRLWEVQVQNLEEQADITIVIEGLTTVEVAWGTFISGFPGSVAAGTGDVAAGTGAVAAGTGFVAAGAGDVAAGTDAVAAGTGFVAVGTGAGAGEIANVGVTTTSVTSSIVSFIMLLFGA